VDRICHLNRFLPVCSRLHLCRSAGLPPALPRAPVMRAGEVCHMLPQPQSECPGFVASRPVWKRGDALPDQPSNPSGGHRLFLPADFSFQPFSASGFCFVAGRATCAGLYTGQCPKGHNPTGAKLLRCKHDILLDRPLHDLFKGYSPGFLLSPYVGREIFSLRSMVQAQPPTGFGMPICAHKP
jgi:hypothetical protein